MCELAENLVSTCQFKTCEFVQEVLPQLIAALIGLSERANVFKRLAKLKCAGPAPPHFARNDPLPQQMQLTIMLITCVAVLSDKLQNAWHTCGKGHYSYFRGEGTGKLTCFSGRLIYLEGQGEKKELGIEARFARLNSSPVPFCHPPRLHCSQAENSTSAFDRSIKLLMGSLFPYTFPPTFLSFTHLQFKLQGYFEAII